MQPRKPPLQIDTYKLNNSNKKATRVGGFFSVKYSYQIKLFYVLIQYLTLNSFLSQNKIRATLQ